MELRLQKDEAELLESILRIYLADLRMEICGTDGHAMREVLKRDKETVKSILAKLEQLTLIAT